jgi:hypothetical protein
MCHSLVRRRSAGFFLGMCSLAFFANVTQAVEVNPSDLTNHDFFELTCTPSEGSTSPMEIHVDVDSLGEFQLRSTKDAQDQHFEDQRTYTNAITWRNGQSSFYLDRMNGTLKKDRKEMANCTKSGGRRF